MSILMTGCKEEGGTALNATGEYNLTKVADSNTTALFIQEVNDELMFGWLGTLWVIVLFIIIFIATIETSNDPSKAFATASFITWVLSLFLMAMELVSAFVMFLLLVLVGVSVVMLKNTETG